MPTRRWSRGRTLESVLLVAFVAIGPYVARALVAVLASPLRGAGLTGPVQMFGSGAPFTDIGWEVSSARALVDPGFSMYASIDVIARLIGMDAYDVGAHTHPPTSVVLWLPLAFAPYALWLPHYVFASLASIGLSMRVMGVGAWIAYPLGVLVALTPSGSFALTTTYPIMAVVLALAWRYRDVGPVAGPAYAILAAARGVGGLLLAYPLLRRQWRTFGLAVAIVAVLVGVAAVAEPTALGEFLRRGAGAVDAAGQNPNVFTPAAVLARHGLPGWLAYVAAVALAALAFALRRSRFWVLFWVSLAVSPLGWVHSLVGVIPFLVVVWRSGRLGVLIVLVNAVVALGVLPASPGAVNASWLFLIMTTAIALVACRLDGERESDGWLASRPAADVVPNRAAGVDA